MPLKGLAPGISLASFPSPIPPVSGGGLPSLLDWSAYQTTFDWSGTKVSVPATSWATFVNVTGEGWVTFVQAYCDGVTTPNIRLTIDGVAYVFNGFSGASNDIPVVVNRPIYFKNSLIIEAFNTSAGADNIGCDYSYLLKLGIPNKSKQTILLAGSRNSGFNKTTSTTATSLVNVTGSGYLLGADFSGFYGTGGGSVIGSLIVDGVTKMNNRNLLTTEQAAYKITHFDGPIRFSNSLQVQHKISTATSTALSRVYYSLD